MPTPRLPSSRRRRRKRRRAARCAFVLASLALASTFGVGCTEIQPRTTALDLGGTDGDDAPGEIDAPAPEPVWGVADLHAHPASFLGFGYDGIDGLFHGAPGLALDDVTDASLLADLSPCDPTTHAGPDTDGVREQTRALLVASSESGWTHTGAGAPDFASWPHARSRLHQQMHVSALHRAWQGGLRLILASTVDNQLLARLYQRTSDDPFPSPTADFDYEAARVQLQHMRDLAAANPEWLAYVTTPAEARTAIGANKLALVPSLEMDSLDADQILALKDEFGVGHVIPIHLVDNSFGGAAVYDDLFNSSNEYLNGELMRVVGDPLLGARLGHPLVLRQVLILALPEKLSRAAYCALGYEPCPDAPNPEAVPITEGHRNAQGLVDAELERLMAAGLMLDLAHMSERAMEDALTLAEGHCYPLLDSHTGVREAGAHAHDERAIRSDHLARMAALGGVLGFGTEGTLAPRTLADARGLPLATITPDAPFAATIASLAPVGLPSLEATVTGLSLTLTVGDDALAGDVDNAFLEVGIRGEGSLRFPLNHGALWDAGSEHTLALPLEGVAVSDLASVSLGGNFGGTLASETWTVDALELLAETAAGDVPIVALSATPALRLDGSLTSARLWTAPARMAGETGDAEGPAERLRLGLETGADGLEEGEGRLEVAIGLADGTEVVASGLPSALAPFASTGVDVLLPRALAHAAIETVEIRLADAGAGEPSPVVTLARISIEALHDPLPHWVEAAALQLERMDAPLLTIGSDFNGLAPQFLLTGGLGETYEIDAHLAFGAPAGSEVLGPSRVGPRRYAIGRDGLAHYGMLPDLFEVLSRQPGSEPVLESLFGSAEAVIQMWESAERAGARWETGGCQ